MARIKGAHLEAIVRSVTPPAALQLALALKRRIKREPPSWEYLPEGWHSRPAGAPVRGWNRDSVVAVYESQWAEFTRLVSGSAPLAVAPEYLPSDALDAHPYGSWDILFHNVVMTYAYALGLAARRRTSVSVLDWGGGVGHYYVLSRALYPDLELEYHCKDLAVAVEGGRRLLPEVHFHAQDDCLRRRYDLVFASGSMHYTEDWPTLLRALGGAAERYLLINQLPIVHRHDTFAVLQRPYSHGYDTEYICWCLNRQAFLAQAQSAGLKLVREFVNGSKPPVHRAPERPEYRGFLFAAPAAAGPPAPSTAAP